MAKPLSLLKQRFVALSGAGAACKWCGSADYARKLCNGGVYCTAVRACMARQKKTGKSPKR